MRLEKVEELRDGVKLTVREMTPRILRNLLMQAPEIKDLSLQEILAERLSEIAGLFGDCLELHGASWEDLSFSEIRQVIETFKEVNRAFFDLTSLAVILAPDESLSDSEENSKRPASSSPSEDTSDAGTTAGRSS